MADHLIDIVNEKDEVIGSALKSKKSELGFISRVAVVFVKDSNGKIIVCKRGPNKKRYPGKYDLTACGNVEPGETYEQTAKRELTEETGIEGLPVMLGKYYCENIHDGIKFKYFVGVFLTTSDQEPKLNEELVLFRRMSVEEIGKEMKEFPEAFCQGFMKDFNLVKNKL